MRMTRTGSMAARVMGRVAGVVRMVRGGWRVVCTMRGWSVIRMMRSAWRVGMARCAWVVNTNRWRMVRRGEAHVVLLTVRMSAVVVS